MRTPNHFDTQLMGMPGGLATLDAEGNLVQKDGLGGKGAATITVGTATAGHRKNDVDFLCTGVKDDEVINAAIQSLSAKGGEVYLLEGTYQITKPIELNKHSIKLCGTGRGTTLNSNGTSNVIRIDENNITVSTLHIQGNKGAGEKSSGVVVTSGYKNYIRIEFLLVENMGAQGIDVRNTLRSTFVFNKCSGCTNAGIYVGGYAIVQGNECRDNGSGIAGKGDCITAVGNICNFNAQNGIEVWGSRYCNASNNTCFGNGDTGIGLFGGSNDSIAVGNICYSCKRGIWVSDDTGYCYVVSNLCRNNTYNIVQNSSTNTIGSNKTS